VTLLACAFVSAPRCSAQSPTNILNLFIWSEYIDPAVVAGFEKKFDCKVTVDLYDDDESMMSKLQGGAVSLYDVIVPSNQLVPALVKLGMLLPLDHQALPNLKNIDPTFINPPYDPGNQYTVPFQWGTLGIYMRKPAGKPIDETWGLIFDAAKQPGEILLLDSYRETIGSALCYLHRSGNTTNIADLKAARDLLLATKQRSLGFEGSVGGVQRVASESAFVAVVYNGDAVKRVAQYTNTCYFVPREGSQIWVDHLAIPAQAPHRPLAEKFLNYILDPRIGAQQANFSQYATPNQSAKKYVKPEDLANPAIYPPPEIMSKLEFTTDLGRQSRLYDEVWTVVKVK